MTTIFEPATLQSLLWRIEKLTPNSQGLWGKMNAGQMMAHCSAVLEIALSDKQVKREIMALIFGKMAKNMIISDKPFKKNLPTDKNFLVTNPVDFDREKTRFIELLTKFSTGGAEPLHNKMHPFFGKMTADEWSASQLKHIDHHLRQFGA